METAITTQDSTALMQLSPERWALARTILAGESDVAVSWAAAARAAGVSVNVLRAWVERSAERNPEDDPWIYEIAEIAATRDELQSGRLEDLAWQRTVKGWKEPVFQGGIKVGTKRKRDHKLLMDLMRVRDPRYQPKPSTVVNTLIADPHELFTRLKAATRLKQIQERGA